MKRFLSVISVTILLFSLCIAPAAAAEISVPSTDVIYFEDGSYLTTTLIIDNLSVARTTYGISGHKNVHYSNASGDILWTLTVYGTFTYNGTTATATSASYSHEVYSSAWSFKSGSAYCSDNQAIAEGKFNGGFLLNRSATVTLTCSPTGVLS